MATYCSHEVRFRGRLLEVGCRYNTPQTIRVTKGKPMPELEKHDFYMPRSLFWANPAGWRHKVMRALMRVLRRQGQLNERGHCKCRFY